MKKVAVIILTISILFSFSACSSGAKKVSQPLNIGVLPDVDSIPLVMAQQNGYFEKAGVKVNIEHFKSAVDRDSALQSGKIDGAVSDILAAAFARDGGFDVKITSMTNGSYKLIAGKNSGITTTPDIRGKSIGISKNTIIEYATDEMLSSSGVKPEEINKVFIPQIPVRLEMLQNGKLDAATLPEPLATVAVKNGAQVLMSTSELEVNPGIIIFTKKAAGSKSDEIKSMYKAYNQAVDYLKKENISNYIDVLIKESGFPESVKGSVSLPVYTKAGLPSVKDFDKVIGWLKNKSLIKNTYKFDDLVDGSFVR